MIPFVERLRRGVILADGAWGSMLMSRGLPPNQSPETWTLERPEILRAIAREYLEAGAEILTTNTFGGTTLALSRHRLEQRAVEINATGVAILRDIAEGRAYVSASIGPTGRLLAPLGDLRPDAAEAAFAAQIETIAEAGADLLCIETMSDPAEAVLAIHAAKRVAPALPVIATMTFELTPRGPYTLMGTSVEAAARLLAEAGADVVGANCGEGVRQMTVVAEAFAAHSRLPVAIRPNAGLPLRQGRQLVYAELPEDFAKAAAALLQPGVAVLGGCCGTTPAHIRALRSVLAARV
ncbi:MAG: hypothetical protein A3H96_05690 [Acidobacteria bacterium RIFCSPLOWO2_02_FULL_67_36]|nr:MAG: hypothetical protein A3H96_05690 [Acidobacteria bacterium RIFCSPLOWO2_02_FULL_67_36]OFW19747.1 MAG: hypothetical protein A3G21_13270 [Acidobacteria bacterium RIFCSPLOWO2_12_FULL_66_21]